MATCAAVASLVEAEHHGTVCAGDQVTYASEIQRSVPMRSQVAEVRTWPLICSPRALQ